MNNGKKETTRQKQPLIYSNRRNKIYKGRTILEIKSIRVEQKQPLC